MRLGNMKGGPEGIKSHSWFSDINFQKVVDKSVIAPWIPVIKSDTDMSLFDKIDDDDSDDVGVIDPNWTWDADF